MKYEIIIFDADDTLYDFTRAEHYAFRETIDAFGITGEKESLFQAYEKVNKALWKAAETGAIQVSEIKVERFRQFFEVIGTHEDPRQFAVSYMDRLSNASFMIDGSEEMIQTLAKEHTLLIITNGLTDVQDRRVRQSAIARYFQNVIISEEVQVSKPDPKIFEIALSAYSCAKDKILMVGDGLASDIQGGINYGIDTCWFNRKGLNNTLSVAPTYEIKQLRAIHDIIR